MSFLNRMYQQSMVNRKPVSDKNPNRVSGGLRAQGVDRVTFVTETGTEQSVATTRYVQSLEERIRSQIKRIEMLERAVNRLDRGNQNVERKTWQNK